MGSLIPLAKLRREYARRTLDRNQLESSPLLQFRKWMNDALKNGVLEPTAMTLATADTKGHPSARTVLLKGIDRRGFVFYTNYLSRKGRELARNRNAAMVFLWREVERQICIRGTIRKVPSTESDAYFKIRPVGSRLAAWASHQSEIVQDRAMLEAALTEATRRYGTRGIPRPPHWGGYVLTPLELEFWQGRPDRLHDRFLYRKRRDGKWSLSRLSP